MSSNTVEYRPLSQGVDSHGIFDQIVIVNAPNYLPPLRPHQM